MHSRINKNSETDQNYFLVGLLNFIIMSLWDWLLAAWIYEEIFDNDSNDRNCDNTCNNDSLRDYDYEDDFDDDF